MSSKSTTDVPWDVVTDVFSRLPVKSLLRFRSIAKSFNALSKDPEFISRHLHRSSKNSSQLLVQTNFAADSGLSFSLLSLKTFDFAVEQHFPAPKSDGMVVVVGSCNGIVCLLCEQGPDIILWNPLTREHITLPPPILPYSFQLSGNGTNFNSVGFGFHNGEYKVVRIASDSIYDVDLAKTEIYSTGSGLWKEIDSNLPRKIYDLTSSVIIKGTPYWIGYENDDLRRCIVLFDMVSEAFQKIDLPWWNNDISGRTCGIGTINDRLAIYFHNDYYDDEDNDRSIDIWAMNNKDSDEIWSKMFVIRNFPVPGWPLGLYDDALFIWAKSTGSLFSSSPSPRDVLVYSPDKEAKSIKCLKDLENVKACAYVESLVQIHGGNRDT